MTIDIDKLEAIAKAAQERSPGPWRRSCDRWRCDGDGCDHCDFIFDSAPRPEHCEDESWEGNRVLETDSGYYEPKGVTAEFIATCSPDVVLALLHLVRLSHEYEVADAGAMSHECDAAYLKWRTAMRAAFGREP